MHDQHHNSLMLRSGVGFLFGCVLLVSAAVAGQEPADTADSLALLRHAIQRHPDDFAAHERFVDYTMRAAAARSGSDDQRARALALGALGAQYAAWAKAFPRSPGIPYGMGFAFSEAQDPRAKPYLVRATGLDPKLGRAFALLAEDASRWGDDRAALAFAERAAAADPTNAQFAYDYAWTMQAVDSARWRAMVQALVRRFPESEAAARGLFWIAATTAGDSDEIALYEQLRRQFPPARSYWSAYGMQSLFDVYMKVAPPRALALGGDMLRAVSEGGDQRGWADRVRLAQDVLLARSLVADHHYAAASAVLSSARIPAYSAYDELFALMRAEAIDSAGDTQRAYDSLAARYARTPSDSVYAAVGRYATKIGMDRRQLDSTVTAIRVSAAETASPFRLGSYASRDSVSLADYRGQVVFLTFWFPGCGTCRVEFPHIQHVVDHFRGRGVAYVGINVVPDQDSYVVPFLHGTGYTFTPLRGTEAFAAEMFRVAGEPTNFLIDRQGRIIFRDFRVDDATDERMLTLMIESLIAGE